MRSGVLMGLAGIYAYGLIDLTLVRFPQPSPSPNLMPMRTIVECCSFGGRTMVVNIAGNLALLAPVGVFLAMGWPDRIGPGRALIAGFLLSVGIEASQYSCGHRTADVDDVLLNAAGAWLGYVVFATIRGAMRPGIAVWETGTPQGALKRAYSSIWASRSIG